MWPSPLYNEINNIFSLASSTDEIFLFYKIPEPYFSDKVQYGKLHVYFTAMYDNYQFKIAM